jgi:hypothetical protein
MLVKKHFPGKLTALLIGTAFAALIFARTPGDSSGTLLADEALSSVFGDGNFTCESITCSDAIGAGTSCDYCDSISDRVICCPGGEKKCTYTGSDNACGAGKTKKTGTVLGTLGTCDSCTASSYVDNGNCDAVKDAKCED